MDLQDIATTVTQSNVQSYLRSLVDSKIGIDDQYLWFMCDSLSNWCQILQRHNITLLRPQKLFAVMRKENCDMAPVLVKRCSTKKQMIKFLNGDDLHTTMGLYDCILYMVESIHKSEKSELTQLGHLYQDSEFHTWGVNRLFKTMDASKIVLPSNHIIFSYSQPLIDTDTAIVDVLNHKFDRLCLPEDFVRILTESINARRLSDEASALFTRTMASRRVIAQMSQITISPRRKTKRLSRRCPRNNLTAREYTRCLPALVTPKASEISTHFNQLRSEECDLSSTLREIEVLNDRVKTLEALKVNSESNMNECMIGALFDAETVSKSYKICAQKSNRFLLA